MLILSYSLDRVQALRTPLNYAAGSNKTEIVQCLLENNANIDNQDHYGRTALHCAVENSHLQVVKILLQHNPDLSVKNKNGETPLDPAQERGHQEIITLLEEAQKAAQPRSDMTGTEANVPTSQQTCSIS